MVSALSYRCDMTFKESIQSKIRWLIISFTMVVSFFLISLLFVYAWVVEDNIFNRIVQEEADYLEREYLQTGTLVAPRIPFISLYQNWNDLPEHVQLLRQQSPDRIEFPLENGGTIHIREIQLGDTKPLLVANVTSYEISRVYLPKLIPWILLILGVVGLCAYVLARYLARSVVNPIQHIAYGVASQTGKQSLQFSQPFANNEIGFLAHTISENFNRLQAALQRETDFSRDISHELRTPVTVLKMVANRLVAQHPLDQTSINKIRTAVNEIEQSLAVLLALSREESMKVETVGLLQEVEHAVINHYSLTQIEDITLNIAIPASYQITCNKNLLHILLNNLLDNAVNHASHLALDITLSDNHLCFQNPVDQVPALDVLAPQVKGHDSEGLGQGLHLVKRICQQFGWDVSVDVKQHQFMLTIALQ